MTTPWVIFWNSFRASLQSPRMELLHSIKGTVSSLTYQMTPLLLKISKSIARILDNMILRQAFSCKQVMFRGMSRDSFHLRIPWAINQRSYSCIRLWLINKISPLREAHLRQLGFISSPRGSPLTEHPLILPEEGKHSPVEPPDSWTRSVKALSSRMLTNSQPLLSISTREFLCMVVKVRTSPQTQEIVKDQELL